VAETAPPQTDTSSGFNKKIAGYPAWAWVTVIAGGAVVLYLWTQHKKNANASTGTDTSQYTPSGNEGLSTEQYEDLLAQLRDIEGAQAGDKDKPSGGSSGGGNKGGEDEPPGKEFRDVRITSNGKQSLNQIAAAHHTSAASIIETTKKHGGIHGKLATYLHRHHFTVKVPSGVSLWIREEQ
jgi:hypothetical protein